MRRIFTLLMILCLLAGLLAGCGKKIAEEAPRVDEPEETTARPLETQTPASETPAAEAPATEAPTTEDRVQQTRPSEDTAAPTEPDNSYLETIPHRDQSIFEGPGYDYKMTGTVEKAGIYTIVEETKDGDGNLWGKLKSGAGWVDLTDIRDPENFQRPITANFAEKKLLENGDYHHFVGDTSEYVVKIAFWACQDLRDVSFFDVNVEEKAEAGMELYHLSELKPDKALVVEVAFPGDMSTYGISFTDSSGAYRAYTVTLSGMNGAVMLREADL